MADRSNIDDKVRDGFGDMNQKAPNGLWDKVSEGMDSSNPVDEKVKSSFAQSKEEAPEAVWTGIEKQLTIDRAWGGVRRFLVRRTWRRRLARAAAVLLLLFGLASGGWMVWNSSTDTQGSLSKSGENGNRKEYEERGSRKEFEEGKNRKEYEEGGLNGKGSRKEYEDGGLNEDKNENGSVVMRGSVDVVNNKAKNEEDRENSEEHPEVGDEAIAASENIVTRNEERKEMKSVPGGMLLNGSMMTLKTISPMDTSFDLLEEPRGFEIGFASAYHFTMVINNNTRQSFDSESLVLSENTFLPAFGISAAYRFNRSHAITTDLFFYHPLVQNNSIYREGMLVDRSIGMSQQRLSINYEYSVPRSERILPPLLYFQSGLFVGRIASVLNSSQPDVITKSKKLSEDLYDYSNVDFGVSLAMGRHVYLGDKFMLDLGVRATKGVINTYVGNDIQPADFDLTTTLTCGAYGSIRYLLD